MTVARLSSAMRSTLPLDWRCAVANVAAVVAFGGRGREQHLLATDTAHQQLMPGAAATVSRHASHLGLMHRVDHGRRGTGAAERVTDVGNLGNAGALAAELAGHGDAQQAMLPSSRDRLRRKPRLGIDRAGMRSRDRRNLLGAGSKPFGVGTHRVAVIEQAAHLAARGGHALQRRCSHRHGCVCPYSKLDFDRDT